MSYNDSFCWSAAAGGVQGAVLVVDSKEIVVAGYWKGEDIAEGAADPIVAGHGESADHSSNWVDENSCSVGTSAVSTILSPS